VGLLSFQLIFGQEAMLTVSFSRAGVEVGGTFTDLVYVENGRIAVAKAPSTPQSPDQGAFNALIKGGVDIAGLGELAHGSTVATNAILERKGARVALIVTKGFRDLLLLQRHQRRRIYDLHYEKPEPVVRRRDTIEVEERLGPNGEIITALNETDARKSILSVLGEREFDAVAICLLNSFVNPLHEESLVRIIEEMFPGMPTAPSHKVAQEFREYERASTTTLSAYVQPVVSRYLKRFEATLTEQAFDGAFSVMQSNGGRMPAAAMAENAISALFSGPAAGVVGAVRQAARSGHKNFITLDVGGTSTDVCLAPDGQPSLASVTEIGGLPVKTPVIDMATVGAGGGSLVWIDDGGMLRVGPESAGADPGPACYGRGGMAPTITDAHVVRGTMQAEAFLAGDMHLDVEKARRSFESLANQFGKSILEIADAAIQLAESNIARAIQRISTERGRDPRDYSLVAFGGAGPMHAVRVAEEIGLSSVIIPPFAGVLSALGLLVADYARYDALTDRQPLNAAAPEIVRKHFTALNDSIKSHFADHKIQQPDTFSYLLDMRYRGQAFEAPVSISESDLPNLSHEDLENLFRKAHEQLYSFAKPKGEAIEIVAYRAGGSLAPPAFPETSLNFDEAVETEIELFERGKTHKALLVSRAALKEKVIHGPILIDDGFATVFIPVGWSTRLDPSGNILIQKEV
jgi:N-methylhydantoinase A